jgi:hypothetical protein
MPQQVYEGSLEAWFETGTEGLVWVLDEDGFESYAAMRFVEEGDHLTVFRPDGEVAFEGVIRCDRETGRPGPEDNCGRSQQSALGFWVHWIQEGWDPGDWAEMFLKEYRAILKKSENPPEYLKDRPRGW